MEVKFLLQIIKGTTEGVENEMEILMHDFRDAKSVRYYPDAAGEAAKNEMIKGYNISILTKVREALLKVDEMVKMLNE